MCDAFTDCCSQVCTDGYCAEVKCPGGQKPCEGTCVDQQADENNCGACNEKCQGDEVCCDGACADTTDDLAHCGSCGKKCAGSQVCCGGGCLNPSSDALNCGYCGNACDASQICVGGACYTNPLCCSDGVNANQPPVQKQEFGPSYGAIAWAYVPQCPMSINGIGLYTDNGEFGIASDNNGSPGQVLGFAQSNSGLQTWRQVTLSPAIPLIAGTTYWILHYANGFTTYLSRATSGTKVKVSVTADGVSWVPGPDDYMVSTVTGDCN